jgi:hypothetical protein
MLIMTVIINTRTRYSRPSSTRLPSTEDILSCYQGPQGTDEIRMGEHERRGKARGSMHGAGRLERIALSLAAIAALGKLAWRLGTRPSSWRCSPDVLASSRTLPPWMAMLLRPIGRCVLLLLLLHRSIHRLSSHYNASNIGLHTCSAHWRLHHLSELNISLLIRSDLILQ